MIFLTRLIAVLLLASTTCFAATPNAQVIPKSVTFDKTRLVRIDNVIVPLVSIKIADDIYRLAEQDTNKPIDILLNSPGGEINFGTFIITAITIAQSRGITVRCHTTIMAASMAFDIFAHCNERYAFADSLLLFHPARAMIAEGLRAPEAAKLAMELDAFDQVQITLIMNVTGMKREDVVEAYYAEKMWHGAELAAVSKPGFLIIIQDIKGIENPFSIMGAK